MRNVFVMGIESKLTDVSESISYMDSLDQLVEERRPDVVLLPEKWINNVFVEGSDNYDNIISVFREFSSRHGILLVPGSLSIQRRSGLFNSSPVFSKGKLLGWQDKLVPFNLEKKYYSGGNEIKVFQAGEIRMGVQVCYDLDFPFMTKIQVSKGIDFILNPSLIVSEFRNMWHLYVKTRSLENRIPVISVNSGSEPFSGNSISTSFLVKENGVLLKTKRPRNGIIECRVNTRLVRELSERRKTEDPGEYSFK